MKLGCVLRTSKTPLTPRQFYNPLFFFTVPGKDSGVGTIFKKLN